MLMVQTNTQPMKNNKIKGPPPVPPRPNQSVVAEALAKTRKAVADSKASFTKSRAFSKQDNHYTSKAKTLDRANTVSESTVSPKQNGLARVKSFIRDVISDRSSSSDERKSSGQNSRRSSSDSSSIPTPTSNKKSNESLNSKAVKTCRQILVRSLSTSNKLDQDSKCKVSKSSSFAEKTLPLRKAPPPPLSPKPKLKPMKPLSVNKSPVHSSKSKISPEISPYSSPIDAKPPQCPVSEAPYASVEEVQEFDDRLRNSPSKQIKTSPVTPTESGSPKVDDSVNKNNNSLERKTSRVTEMLISEIIASRNNNKDEAHTVIDKGKDGLTNGNHSPEMEMMKDMNNHEMLIYELQTMRSQSNVPETLDAPEYAEANGQCDSEDSEQNYAMSSVTSGNTDDDQAYAYILDDDLKSRLRKQFRAISTMSLQGLPPLPKSLSGFADGEPELQDTPSTPSDKPPTDLDSQLAYLKKEMASLRQLDLSLLSELWTLSEAMASWRRQLERGPRLRPAPPPPPPPHYLRT
ncbi:uncharacterized protein LOC124629626 isoform X1 [Helicoverpa zea]|uniref:uncharacterized protein LOC124629626 isoform X1 n=1 Tax=Helicoverpa zea TaxID=7113 RepID=UPI001F577277|nr:uncharacterized protein LOC124629626 isoform X1 [Helicoverpa zea]